MARSHAKTWDDAKPEWELVEVYRSKTPRTCLCGHSPIIEVCNLQNKVTGVIAPVGNHCVRVVLGLPSGRIFQAYRRVRADPSKSLNKEALTHAYKMGWITILECDFYCGVMRKRKLTPERLELKANINKRFVRCMEPSARPDDSGSFHVRSAQNAATRAMPLSSLSALKSAQHSLGPEAT